MRPGRRVSARFRRKYASGMTASSPAPTRSRAGRPRGRLGVALFALLAGCSMAADADRAAQAVPKFHEMLDAGRFEDIYAGAADDLKGATPQKDFVALLEAVHRKLGNTKSSTQQGWNVNYHTSGTFVTLNYATAYAEGDASEQFVYRLRANEALLAGYHVNSNALILK